MPESRPTLSADTVSDVHRDKTGFPIHFRVLWHSLRAVLFRIRYHWSGSTFRLVAGEFRRFPLRIAAILSDPLLRLGPAIPDDPRQHGQMSLAEESKYKFACNSDIVRLSRAHKWMGPLDTQIAAKAYQEGFALAFRISDAGSEIRDKA
jgi:hypothetical protein